MSEVIDLKIVDNYAKLVGQETLHPLVNIIDLSLVKFKEQQGIQALKFGFYAIYLKGGNCSSIRYGRNTYDYQDGTLVFIGPGQVIQIARRDDSYRPEGYALMFHPDLLLGTPLSQKIKSYNFFSYEVHEALHLSEREKQITLDSFTRIKYELEHGIDKHSKSLVVATIDLLLGYCVRFYDRQFITRDHVNQGVLHQFSSLLDDYFRDNKSATLGLPSVSYFAEQLNLSANYFGDLIKNKTGQSAQDYIHTKLLKVAKERVFDPTKTVSEIAYELGFKYPQHFSRFFKQRVGCSPSEFRTLN